MTQGTPELPAFAAFLGSELELLHAQQNRAIAKISKVSQSLTDMQMTSAAPALAEIQAPAIASLDPASGSHIVT